MEHYLTYYHNSSLSLKNFLHFPEAKKPILKKFLIFPLQKIFLYFEMELFSMHFAQKKKVHSEEISRVLPIFQDDC